MSTAVLPADRIRGHFWVVVVGIVLAVFAAYFLMPLWWLSVTATKLQGDFATTNGFWFSGFHLMENLRALFGYDHGIFARWLLNSALYAGVGALIGTVLSSMAGYYLAKFSFRGRRFLFSLILGAVMVPAAVLALPLFLVFSKAHLVDTYWAVLLPSIVSPFGVYISRIFADSSVPTEIIEAARVDGAGEFRIFATIAQRLMLPGLATVYLFGFVAIWNNFFLPLLMLQSQDLYPATFGLFAWKGQSQLDPHVQLLVVIGSFVSTAPLIGAFLALQRYWRAGLTLGAVD
ncbi:carbohydrate ABC transporter permease [Kribbella solani]|uniref:Multiple sugar transport system permease protein n=1 Tax=Kribbella solani TaxID=236067 RepID=A0A841DWB9_9ACTN|nr:carbohydrate ABC transporter permease [Kribbella solani]MBB5982883.1 multiple sugar transport system permease protein [Kribbella solani]MDX2973429.1 carbohydrate ABC transporter permease [Kribbella solani]MDX3000843.1 carbohydrate ABC transporter permease [Kribbella solani]